MIKCIYLKCFLIISVIFFSFWGCISGGTQLSIDRQDGASTGTPEGNPEGAPTGATGSLPVLEKPFQENGIGRVTSSSEHFKSVGGLSFVYGRESSGNIYRMVSPGLSLAQTQIKTP